MKEEKAKNRTLFGGKMQNFYEMYDPYVIRLRIWSLSGFGTHQKGAASSQKIEHFLM